jgi:multidrug efflux system membrane fusion protein
MPIAFPLPGVAPMKPVRRAAFAVLIAALGIVGCQRRAAQAPPPEPPVIPVSHPVEREVTDFAEYTGRTDAKQSVNVRARVTGYLTKMLFEEGEEVKTGDLLYEIDPRPYQAQVDQAEGQLNVYKAQLKLAEATYERAKGSMAAFSALELEQDRAAVEQANAQVNAAKASLEVYKLNLEFTKVKSPIDGVVSRYYYTVGNLVSQDQTMLTTIVSMSPMYAYFDVEEKTFQRLAKGRITSVSSRPDNPVLMGLEGEQGFPHRGKLNFINNQVNPSTGTVAVRAIFENVRGEGEGWSLIPGMFARIRLPLGAAHKALLVIDKAIGSDQGLKFVYVVDAENKVQYRRVAVGSLQDDGLRAIEGGLKPDDWVVVGALQQLRPRAEVKPEPTPMPTMSGDEAPTPSRRKPQPQPPGGKGDKKGDGKKGS